MPQRNLLARAGKTALTFVLASAAVVVVWELYAYYTYAPQTRDGKISADVVPLAADVSGRITAVYVHDNQVVQRGQVLFLVDRERLANALERADAAVGTAKATMESADREDRRYRSLSGVASKQDIDTRRSAADQARASYAQAIADRDLARINLARSEVRAPVNGVVTNFSLRPGTYATASSPVMALVDTDSFFVSGYFEETKLPRIHDGARVTVRVMGESQPILGHVSGLSAGIDDRERTTTAGTLLANVSPTFSWVRLAQRVPVRIAIDHVPAGMVLIAGRTATVSVDGSDAVGRLGKPGDVQ